MTVPSGDPEHTGMRAGVASVASSLVPGAGQLMLGRRRVGIFLLIVDVMALGASLTFALTSPSDLLAAWVTPSSLVVLFLLNLAGLAFRGGAAVDSYVHGERRGPLDWIGGVVAGAVVVLPHILVAVLILTQYDLIDTVFAEADPVAAPPPASMPTTVPAPGLTKETEATTTTTASTTTTAAPRIWDGHERLNIMLLGSDAGVGRIGTRTDTIILVSIEPESGDVAMFSIPRNLTEAPLPVGMGLWSCHCFPDIITHLWANGEWYPDAFPGPQSPSVNALKAAVGLIFDVDVHYYAKVDLAGFVSVVDAIGGVTIDVPKRIVDETYPSELGGTENVVIDAGVQHLDGHLALAYARIRRHSGDFARMHRQRCVLGAIVENTDVFDLITGYRDLAEAVKSHVETDIPAERLGDFVELLSRMEVDRLASLRITRYNYGAGGNASYQLYDLEKIKSDAQLLMADPTIHLDTQDGDGLDATCDESFD
jgi:LCP family protein required for cell wall assembly